MAVLERGVSWAQQSCGLQGQQEGLWLLHTGYMHWLGVSCSGLYLLQSSTACNLLVGSALLSFRLRVQCSANAQPVTLWVTDACPTCAPNQLNLNALSFQNNFNSDLQRWYCECDIPAGELFGTDN